MTENLTLADLTGGLPVTVLGYLREAVSPNTRRAYVSDLRQFEVWGGAIPCSPETVARYLSDHAGYLSIATMTRRLAAISVAHAARGFSNPIPSPLVKGTFKGIKRLLGVPQQQAKPLLVEDLLRIIAVLGNSAKDDRDRALLLIGFAGGFRRSELVGLQVNDVDLVRQGMTVTLRRSKSDQSGDGRKIGIPFARGRFCPVRSLEVWLERSQTKHGLIFRALNRHGATIADKLSAEAVSQIVKSRAAQIGLNPEGYSGHSLRAGLCTSAAAAGISTLAIRQQTGHRSDQMIARYVRNGELFTNNVAGALL